MNSPAASRTHPNSPPLSRILYVALLDPADEHGALDNRQLRRRYRLQHPVQFLVRPTAQGRQIPDGLYTLRGEVLRAFGQVAVEVGEEADVNGGGGARDGLGFLLRERSEDGVESVGGRVEVDIQLPQRTL